MVRTVNSASGPSDGIGPAVSSSAKLFRQETISCQELIYYKKNIYTPVLRASGKQIIGDGASKEQGVLVLAHHEAQSSTAL